MTRPLTVTVAGLAVWDRPDATRPHPELLPANERRRAPDSVAVALEVAHQACRNAQRDPAHLATVFASTYGDLAITDYMCSTLAKSPTALSPTRFHNSVHNAAAGYWTIATGCREPYCALSAGDYTFAAGLFAAALQACADGTDVLYVAYDTHARGEQTQIAHSRGMLGLALVLTAGGTGGRGLELAVRRRAAAAVVADNAMGASLPFIAALSQDQGIGIDLPLGPGSSLESRLAPR